MKDKVLVTGGTGYIGSHTVVELQNSGYDVIIADDLSNSYADVIDRIEQITGKRPYFEQINLAEKEKVDNLFGTYTNIKAIAHFAALKAVGESVKTPLKYYHNNLVSLINLLDAMKQFNIPSMVFSSSCTVYGQPDTLPVDETAPIKKAESPYGNTKQMSEEIIQDTIKAYPELKSISLRYFNPIGAHESAVIGELPLGVPENLVPFVTQTAMGIRDQIKVFGTDYNTPDGSAIRDYIHVVDLAKAHVIAIKRMLAGKNKTNFEYFNLGTGKGSSVLEVLKTFEEVTGIDLNYKITGRRPGDIEKVWADTKYANEELGWEAERSLGDALLSAWEWEKYYRKNIQN